MPLDRNANNQERLRRNSQRAKATGITAAVRVTAPLQNTGSTIQVNLLSTGGLQTSSSQLSLKLDAAGTGLSLSASGLKYTSPLTTKGDLLGFSTLPIRIPVGADTFVLTADSTQTLGLKWAASATGLTSSNFVFNETPAGLVDGANAVYTLANTPTAGTVRVYKNGLRMNAGAGNDYTISSGTITFASAPPLSSIILVDYLK